MLAEIYLVRLEMMLRSAALTAAQSDTRFVPIAAPRTPVQDDRRKTA